MDVVWIMEIDDLTDSLIDGSVPVSDLYKSTAQEFNSYFVLYKYVMLKPCNNITILLSLYINLERSYTNKMTLCNNTKLGIIAYPDVTRDVK